MRVKLKEQFLKQKKSFKQIMTSVYPLVIQLHLVFHQSDLKNPKNVLLQDRWIWPSIPKYIKSTINCFSSKFMSIVNLNYFRERLLWQITLFCVTQWVWKYVGWFLNVGLTFKLVYRPCATYKKNLDLLGIEKKLNASFGVNTINCIYVLGLDRPNNFLLLIHMALSSSKKVHIFDLKCAIANILGMENLSTLLINEWLFNIQFLEFLEHNFFIIAG